MYSKSKIEISYSESDFIEHNYTISQKKFLQLGYDDSIRIVENLLQVFKDFVSNIHSFFTYENEEDFCRVFVWKDEMPQKITIAKFPYSIYSSVDHNMYYLYYKGKNYTITFFDDADSVGYCTSYEYDRYIMCRVREVTQESTQTTREIYFTFDIIDMRFLELFSVDRIGYNNSENGITKILRSSTEDTISQIENKYRDSSLMFNN